MEEKIKKFIITYNNHPCDDDRLFDLIIECYKIKYAKNSIFDFINEINMEPAIKERLILKVELLYDFLSKSIDSEKISIN